MGVVIEAPPRGNLLPRSRLHSTTAWRGSTDPSGRHDVAARARVLLLTGMIVFSARPFAHAQATPSVNELKKLTVAELMNIDVTSVSRAVERRDRVAAALAVVTSEDIRRSGATTVAETLRLVPGIHVARQTSSQWAISSRGFSSVNSEKLLVLSDTRSIYTPLFSGVWWDVQDYLLQDIERIEVIRGPGATLWGSNAVNGVINISTKSAKDTQGVYAELSAGNEEHVSFAARYGGRLGSRGHYRVFGKYFDRGATVHPATNSACARRWICRPAFKSTPCFAI